MTVQLMIDYEETHCITCGVPFFVPKEMMKALRENQKLFYCPSGHGQCFSQSEVDRLRKELSVKNNLIASKDNHINNLERQLEQERQKKRRAKRII